MISLDMTPMEQTLGCGYDYRKKMDIVNALRIEHDEGRTGYKVCGACGGDITDGEYCDTCLMGEEVVYTFI